MIDKNYEARPLVLNIKVYKKDLIYHHHNFLLYYFKDELTLEHILKIYLKILKCSYLLELVMME